MGSSQLPPNRDGTNGEFQSELLWSPASTLPTSALYEFRAFVQRTYPSARTISIDDDCYCKGTRSSPKSLYAWSVEHVADFWEAVWQFTSIRSSAPFTHVIGKDVDGNSQTWPRPVWFRGTRMNFAENILYPPVKMNDTAVAVIEANETGPTQQISWHELRERVRVCAGAMKTLKIEKGDRVAGFLGNNATAVVAMLAAASIGAIWSGTSLEFGSMAVLDRLNQVTPKLLFVDNASLYNGKVHDALAKVNDIVLGLSSPCTVVIVRSISSHPDVLQFDSNRTQKSLDDFTIVSLEDFLSGNADKTLEFAQLPFDHPLYILYSSGTTGAPKCIVHSAGGTLLQHKKEHMLHGSLASTSILFQYTTVTWMMWHWLVSALSVGSTIVLYDGSPFHPSGDATIPNLIGQLEVTDFGTSAKYLSTLEAHSFSPSLPLTSLKTIFSTGSPLAPSTFRYVYRSLSPSVHLASITGGTDIISLFGAPWPSIPVHAGEIQGFGLGMDVRVYDPSGGDITATGEEGELVCVAPFPCQPVTFYGPGGEEKYRASYFCTYPGVWAHGDFVRVNPRTGGVWMLGRSDGVLKPAGVRFGSAEIYNVLLSEFAEEIVDAVCIGRRRENDLDEIVCLFVVLCPGISIEHLRPRIRDAIKKALSPRHVPSVIEVCPEVPITINGKKVEVAVKQVISGKEVRASASIANKTALDWFKRWAHEN